MMEQIPILCGGSIPSYYTSRENTLIPLDESHVSRLLATCVSVGSVTAGATQGVAPAVKETTY